MKSSRRVSISIHIEQNPWTGDHHDRYKTSHNPHDSGAEGLIRRKNISNRNAEQKNDGVYFCDNGQSEQNPDQDTAFDLQSAVMKG